MIDFWHSKSKFLPLLSPVGGNMFSKKCYLSGINNIALPRDKRGVWKRSRFNAVSRNLNTIYLKNFSTCDRIFEFDRKFNKHCRERWNPKKFIETWKDISLKDISYANLNWIFEKISCQVCSSFWLLLLFWW